MIESLCFYLRCLSAALLCYTGFQNYSFIRCTSCSCSTCCFGLGFQLQNLQNFIKISRALIKDIFLGGLMQNCRRQGPSSRRGLRALGCTARGPARHNTCPQRPVRPGPQAQARRGVHTEPAGRDEARHRDAGPAVCWLRGGPEKEHGREPDEVLGCLALLREASAPSLCSPCASERLCACGCSFSGHPM